MVSRYAGSVITADTSPPERSCMSRACLRPKGACDDDDHARGFERETDTFNAHDVDAFAKVLADDVVFVAPGGMRGKGKAACVAFYGSGFDAFPDARVEVHGVHIIGDLAVEEGTFTGHQNGVLPGSRSAASFVSARRARPVNPVAALRW